MKLKVILLISSLCLFGMFLFFQLRIWDLYYNACDIPNLNDQFKLIEEALNKNSIAEVEEQYACNIILRSDTSYSNELYTAIKKADIILDYMEGEVLLGKIIIPANSDSFTGIKRELSLMLWVVFAGILVIIYTTVFLLYRKILLPFQRLKNFAGNISTGNLELPLIMDKGNYFGAFTESFDLMREELKRARQGEYEANRSKKELVAELSHDIKTPVATIKALCEILDIKLQEEEVLSKIHIIEQKADMVDKLISNMFHATLEELEALKIEPKEEYSTILITMFEELNHYGKIELQNTPSECLIYCDKLRLTQVIDNVINNSYKYANTKIDVSFSELEEMIEVEIRDYGSSISEDELQLLFQKYYRGENASTQSGSGLGLYLAKQFMEGMSGGIECISEGGFVVRLFIKKV